MPFGLGPKSWCLVPSGATALLEVMIQLPTSWSLSDFCCASAAPESAMLKLSKAVDPRASVVRRFIVFSFGCPEGSGRALETARGRAGCAFIERKYGSEKYKYASELFPLFNSRRDA